MAEPNEKVAAGHTVGGVRLYQRRVPTGKYWIGRQSLFISWSG